MEGGIVVRENGHSASGELLFITCIEGEPSYRTHEPSLEMIYKRGPSNPGKLYPMGERCLAMTWCLGQRDESQCKPKTPGFMKQGRS